MANPETYLRLALEEVPRILSLQDRNRFSPSYGCFHRAYWLHRTSDFPSAIAQQGVHTLALLWAHDFSGNVYYRNSKILQWCLAGIDYWITIQKNDGSFDEWYPNERGWAGPTGYLVHAMADSFFLLNDAFPASMLARFKQAVAKAAHYLVQYNEEYVLANHHAIALLPIYEAYLVTKDESLLAGFEKRFEEFLTYCHDEGWSLEYDGADIGYQAATIGFLARLHRHWPDARIEKLIEGFVDFTSYHLYPDGTFGGSLGSRQTVHFYPYGYEYWAQRFPMAAKMARRGLEFYARGQLVAPGAQEDHYVLYRVPEFIEAYVQRQRHAERAVELPLLPYEGLDFERRFPRAGIIAAKRGLEYWVINLRRGGVIKGFDTASGKVMMSNAGWIGRLADGRVLSSQWNGVDYRIEMSGAEHRVSGHGHFMVLKLFTPLKMVAFRLFMIMFGWHAASAHRIKAVIRRMLMVGARKGPVRFERTIRFGAGFGVEVRDSISLDPGATVTDFQIGDDFPVRYVPQSRYFQASELANTGRFLTELELQALHAQRTLTIVTTACAE